MATAQPIAASPPGKFTRIHGRWYDVTKFEDVHPGGRLSINLGVSRDATALFESYHALPTYGRNAHLRSILDDLLVTNESTLLALEKAFPAATLADGGFDWSFSPTRTKSAGVDQAEDPFQRDILAAAHSYFAGEAARRGISLREAMKATPSKSLQLAASLATYVGSIAILVMGWWPAVFIAPIAIWIAAVNFWHDASHFAVSTNWRINAFLVSIAPFFSSPWDWYHQHIIGHHNYTNIPGLDPDLCHVPKKLQRLHPAWPWCAEHEKQASVLSFLVHFSIAIPVLTTVNSALHMIHGHLNYSVRMYGLSTAGVALNALRAFLLAITIFGWPWVVFQNDFWKSLAFSVIPWCLFSTCFMVSSQINHISESTMSYRSPHWYRHQCATARDVAPQSWLVELFTGGLSHQVVHHLFPGVNHCHLAALQPAIMAAAARYGVPYTVSPTLWHALAEFVRHVRILSVKPLQSSTPSVAEDVLSNAGGPMA